MGKPDRGQKRKASYFKQHGGKKGKIWSKLDSGMRGVLITCNKREREAVREAYNLLNEYADKLYGPEKIFEDEQVQSSGEEEEEEDIEAALKKEVDSLKEVKPAQRRFQQVDTGTNNVLFIKTSLEDPTELVTAIFSDCLQSQQSKSRFILRMLPVLGTCQAYDDRITKTTTDLLEPLLSHGQPTSYSLNIKVRNNNGVSRTSLLPVLGRVVEELNPNARVNFSDPEHIINVDVLKKVFCIGCLKDFTKFRKYNLQEIIESTKTVNKKKGDGEGKGEEVEGEGEGQEGVVGESTDEPSLEVQKTDIDATDAQNKDTAQTVDKGSTQEQNTDKASSEVQNTDKSGPDTQNPKTEMAETVSQENQSKPTEDQQETDTCVEPSDVKADAENNCSGDKNKQNPEPSENEGNLPQQISVQEGEQEK